MDWLVLNNLQKSVEIHQLSSISRLDAVVVFLTLEYCGLCVQCQDNVVFKECVAYGKMFLVWFACLRVYNVVQKFKKIIFQ